MNNDQQNQSELLTPKELSERYKNTVTIRTLANWRSTKQGPKFVKVGGRVMYRVGDVTQWEVERESRKAS